MLADLAAAHPAVAEDFAEASEGAGVDLWALAQQGPQERLDTTEFTQPALLAAGVAVYRLWLAQGGPRPAVVAGHSLGALMAPRVAERAPELAGLILIAAPARPLQDIVLQQVKYLAASDGDLAPEEQAGIEDIANKAAAVATLSADTPASDTLLGLPAAYWIDLRTYDPITVARTLPQPILVLQGGRDYQVTADGDFARWQAAFAGDARVRLERFPALNHLMIAGAGPSSPQEYALEGHVDNAVIDAIAGFVGKAQP